jgi:hypothetical protein
MSTRVVGIYALSLFGTGMVAYLRGKRGSELALDTVVQGAVVGTGANVLAWYAYGGKEAVLNSSIATGMGTLSNGAVSFLSQLDVKQLYDNLQENGVTIAPVPENPSVVIQDDE